ncbi:cupredoxin domain-containing protein [Paenibacillus pini]|uniref:Oxidoreductase cytochrome C oxidase polypeptide n=1 Tax=Paenibacillus pini JCM 16418 TaxID=1236976 RepID=W7YMV8_9BACL|nr:cupredoxin domain-containing protein [Paenibacillus pini]GAF08958.1 oxidoreductase cytochrome C oxidase polypeptide [Paenibacillus pini JCM 16418]
MNKVFSLIAVAALSATVLSACGSSDSKDTATDNSASGSGSGTQEITVNAKSFEFTPKEIKVKKGDKVKLTLKNTEGAHGLAIPDFNVDLKKDGTAEFTADKAGTYDFNCSVMCGAGHENMVGQLIVE